MQKSALLVIKSALVAVAAAGAVAATATSASAAQNDFVATYGQESQCKQVAYYRNMEMEYNSPAFYYCARRAAGGWNLWFHRP